MVSKAHQHSVVLSAPCICEYDRNSFCLLVTGGIVEIAKEEARRRDVFSWNRDDDVNMEVGECMAIEARSMRLS